METFLIEIISKNTSINRIIHPSELVHSLDVAKSIVENACQKYPRSTYFCITEFVDNKATGQQYYYNSLGTNKWIIGYFLPAWKYYQEKKENKKEIQYCSCCLAIK